MFLIPFIDSWWICTLMCITVIVGRTLWKPLIHLSRNVGLVFHRKKTHFKDEYQDDLQFESLSKQKQKSCHFFDLPRWVKGSIESQEEWVTSSHWDQIRFKTCTSQIHTTLILGFPADFLWFQIWEVWFILVIWLTFTLKGPI